jgi:hypothetical protein
MQSRLDRTDVDKPPVQKLFLRLTRFSVTANFDEIIILVDTRRVARCVLTTTLSVGVCSNRVPHSVTDL